jgi:lysophospholipase L1-like esterase
MARKNSSTKTSKKISSSELFELLENLDIDDAELAKYFKVDASQSDGFSPKLVLDQALVDDDGIEGARLLNAANGIARWRRNRRYKKRIKGWNGVKIVAEGDSWFQYPFILKDTIDQLSDLDNFEYAIFGLSEAGDLLANIVAEDELTRAIKKENPDVFLISAGGNDMVGQNRIAKMVHSFEAKRDASDYPNEQFKEFLEELTSLYRALFTRLLQQFPQLKIICHGYDNAIPANGSWLGKPLMSKGIKAAALQKDIVAEMIRRFNEAIINLAKEFPGAVYHVDCRDVIGTKPKWHDELHPKDDGYFSIATLFDKTIKEALGKSQPSPQFEVTTEMLSHFSVGSKPLSGLRELKDDEFANLVVARATQTMSIEVDVPKNRTERREIESNLEKINKQADFLPSSFLEVGVIRAQSVCRITTEVPLGIAFGSGFLCGNRNFIMTNNHVLPDKSSAAASTVEFDYDHDTTEYRVTLRPEEFFLTSKELDFTIVACDPSALPDTIEAVKLPRGKHLITRKERVNIVQHPQGRRKEIALHDNTVSYVYDKAIRYTTDTEGGSSGSPVFNNRWELCALHHAGWKGDDGAAINEGIRISAIVEYLSNIDNEHLRDTIEVILKGLPTQETRSADRGVRKNGTTPDITINLNSTSKGVTINVND